MDWKGLGSMQSALLLLAGSDPRADHVAQSFIQLGFDNLQRWSLYNLSGHTLLNQTNEENVFFLTANLNLLCSMAIASQPLAMLCCKEAASACSVTSTKALEAAARSPIKPSESQFPSMQALQHTLGAMVLFYEMQFCVSKLWLPRETAAVFFFKKKPNRSGFTFFFFASESTTPQNYFKITKYSSNAMPGLS